MAWIRIMNHDDSILTPGFQGSLPDYELCSFVNNMIACYLSNNFEVLPVFIKRARMHMGKYPPREQTRIYYERVNGFLNDLHSFLSHKASVSEIKPLHGA